MRIFAKLLVIMVAVGAMGLALLSLRQQRYEVSNEISRAHNRIVEQERGQWRLRANIAGRSDPADIRSYAERLKLDLAPIQESAQESADAASSTLATPATDALGGKSPAKTESTADAPKKADAPKGPATKKRASTKKPTPAKGAAKAKGTTRGQ
ncbi:MAG: hypothetical protein EBU31_07505 [Proteobacteria bacterium]|nr:hypothetical protein [Pseudomonadota bacterium]